MYNCKDRNNLKIWCINNVMHCSFDIEVNTQTFCKSSYGNLKQCDVHNIILIPTLSIKTNKERNKRILSPGG
jgi:hypothetical protein